MQDDRDVQQAIAMGEHGLARLRGRGRRTGRESRFVQSREVATEHVDELPATWEEARQRISEWLKGQLRRFLDDTTS